MAKIKQKLTRPMPKDISLETWYRKKMLMLVGKMARESEKTLLNAWRTKTPAMANDAGSATTLNNVLRTLRHNWKVRFNIDSKKLAREFTRRAEQGTTRHLKTLLKEVGFGIEFKLTKRLNDILQANIAHNISLIKRVQGVYYDQIETVIMQGVQNGRDLEYIRKELQDRYNMIESRAVLIAKDQTNKATGAIARERTLETGLTKVTWSHFGGKKMDRSSHSKMDGKEFDLRYGLYDNANAVKRNVQPGELINCNCKYRVVVPDMGQDGGIVYNKKKKVKPLSLSPYMPRSKKIQDYKNKGLTNLQASRAYFDENLRNTFVRSLVSKTVNGVVRNKRIDAVFTGGTWSKFKNGINDLKALLLKIYLQF